MRRKLKLDSYLSLPKNQFKMIKDRKTFQDRGTGNDFLNTTPISQEIIAGIEKRGLQQIKPFLHSKGNDPK